MLRLINAFLACALALSSGCASAVATQPRIVAADGLSSSALSATTPTRLTGYNVNPNKVFVAGISSGGFFGVQMHVAHSATFKGAAIYAGGVYYCATGSVELALLNCGGETLPTGQASYHSTLAQSEQYFDRQSSLGTIDPKSNLSGQPVYLWSGTNDSVVNPLEMADLQTEYAHYGARVTFDSTFPANHGWESPDGEVACGTAATPYMIACRQGTQPYDSVKTWLTQFFGPLKPRNDAALKGTLRRFDQTEFGAKAGNSLDTNGYVFVPKQCAAGSRCGFVLALHGCLQNQSLIGTKFVTESGIDEWADSNGIVVLYPYAVQSPGPSPYNPNGCWDWWGYDDANYSLRSGTQMSVLYAMVQRVVRRP
ncbi:MAG: hypothetical protein M3R53_10485 [Candidatus Eremiobacteraeota bacterium]|nr:hypothetical protein [Candidatus Eremiobacteraeota bacterium]